MPARQGIRQQELRAYISDPKHEVERAGFECRESFETSELAPGDTPPPQNYTPSLSHTVSPTEDQVFNRMSLQGPLSFRLQHSCFQITNSFKLQPVFRIKMYYTDSVVCACTCVCASTRGNERATCRRSLFTLWIPGIESRSSGLAASNFTH